jgi:DNA-binding NarL/FixJ family response regulator
VRQMWIHSGREPAPARRSSPQTTVALAVPGLLIAESLARLLRDHEMRVVGCYETRAALADRMRRSRPTIALIDAGLLGDGLADLGRAAPDTRLVVLADAVDPALARGLASGGARGVILRSSTAADAVATLVQVSRGLVSFPAPVRAALGDA